MRKFLVIMSILTLLALPFAAADANDAFPLNTTFTRIVGYNAGIVFIQQKVTPEMTSGGTSYFKYAYTITYNGPDHILFSWQLLDPFLSGRAARHIFPMKDGTTYNFVFESSEKPVWADGQAMIFQQVATENINYFYVLIRDTTREGPIPPSLLKYLQR